MTHVHDVELQINMAITELHRSVSCLQTGTERLFNHRLPSCFINTTGLIGIHKRLSHDATQRNLKPVSMNAASFLQFETSFIIDKHLLHIFLHVPLMDPSQNLELLQFYAIPISITPTLHMKISTSEAYLAIGRDGLHTTISQELIRSCYQYAELRFCDEPLILSKQIDQSCLGAIYSQNFTQVQRRCPATFFTPEESIEKLSSNEVIIYTETPQTILVTCKTGSQHIAITNTKLIKLEQGCTVSTKHHLFKTGFDLQQNEDIQQWPMIWNISQTLFNIEPSTLESIVHALNLIDNHPAPIRDIKKIVWMNQHKTINIALSTVISIIMIVLISVMAFLTYRYCRLAQTTANPKSGHSENVTS